MLLQVIQIEQSLVVKTLTPRSSLLKPQISDVSNRRPDDSADTKTDASKNLYLNAVWTSFSWVNTGGDQDNLEVFGMCEGK